MGHSRLHKVELEKLGHYFDRIRGGGNRLLRLLNDLLNLSKLESGKMEFLMQQGNLVDIIKRATEEVETLITDRELTVVIEATDLNTITYFDKEKILQVLINLLSNAIKFTPIGKQITIFFDPHISAQPNVQHAETDLLTVVVDDQGLGIPQEEETTIFDKFIQSSKTNTGAGGTGLGLSIVKEIINAHNGYIAATGNPDGGARFRFSLPIITHLDEEIKAEQVPEVDFF
jgi:signal transduction histidine kinase